MPHVVTLTLIAAIIFCRPARAEDVPYVDWSANFDEPVQIPDHLITVFKSGEPDSQRFLFMPTAIEFPASRNGKPLYRVLWNLIDVLEGDHNAGRVTVATRLRADQLEIGKAADWIRSHFPAAQFGVATPKHVNVTTVGNSSLVGSNASEPLDDKALTWMTTLSLTALGVRAVANDGGTTVNFSGVRYDFDIEGTRSGRPEERRFTVGMTADFSCKQDPDNFINEVNLQRGCLQIDWLQSKLAQVATCEKGVLNDEPASRAVLRDDCLLEAVKN